MAPAEKETENVAVGIHSPPRPKTRRSHPSFHFAEFRSAKREQKLVGVDLQNGFWPYFGGMADERHASLIQLFRDRTKPLPAAPAKVEKRIPNAIGRVKAVIFDVYGTLIRSGAGDISLAQPANQSEIIRRLLQSGGFELAKSSANYASQFNQEIQRRHQESRRQGMDFPEVDILEIWSALIRQWTRQNSINPLGLSNLRRLAIEYECAVNPVWPNEGCREIIDHCRRAGLRLGIVSNAQFYTPLMLEALLGKTPSALGFHPALQLWSYLEKRAKPDPALCETIARRLQSQFRIQRKETIFIGNDMRKDIWSAQQAGLRGVLFAGDRRSLRLRLDDVRCRNLKPYAVVTSLLQIRELLAPLGADESRPET